MELLLSVYTPPGKRDPPNPSATAKDIQREAEIDAQLKDPPSHPFLKTHDRRASRVDVDVRIIKSCFRSHILDISDTIRRQPNRLVPVLFVHPSKLHPIL